MACKRDGAAAFFSALPQEIETFIVASVPLLKDQINLASHLVEEQHYRIIHSILQTSRLGLLANDQFCQAVFDGPGFERENYKPNLRPQDNNPGHFTYDALVERASKEPNPERWHHWVSERRLVISNHRLNCIVRPRSCREESDHKAKIALTVLKDLFDKSHPDLLLGTCRGCGCTMDNTRVRELKDFPEIPQHCGPCLVTHAMQNMIADDDSTRILMPILELSKCTPMLRVLDASGSLFLYKEDADILAHLFHGNTFERVCKSAASGMLPQKQLYRNRVIYRTAAAVACRILALGPGHPYLSDDLLAELRDEIAREKVLWMQRTITFAEEALIRDSVVVDRGSPEYEWTSSIAEVFWLRVVLRDHLKRYTLGEAREMFFTVRVSNFDWFLGRTRSGLDMYTMTVDELDTLCHSIHGHAHETVLQQNSDTAQTRLNYYLFHTAGIMAALEMYKDMADVWVDLVAIISSDNRDIDTFEKRLTVFCEVVTKPLRSTHCHASSSIQGMIFNTIWDVPKPLVYELALGIERWCGSNSALFSALQTWATGRQDFQFIATGLNEGPNKLTPMFLINAASRINANWKTKELPRRTGYHVLGCIAWFESTGEHTSQAISS